MTACVEVDVGGGDEPERGRNRALAADPLDLLLLDGPQQLGLEIERQVADLVEEERAAARQLELADPLLHGAGEGALLVAEQMALDQVPRDRRHVDGDEGAVGVLRVAVDAARQQLLAGAALPEDQHRGVGPRHFLRGVEHVAKRQTRAGDELALCPRPAPGLPGAAPGG